MTLGDEARRLLNEGVGGRLGALLQRRPGPTDEEIDELIAGLKNGAPGHILLAEFANRAKFVEICFLNIAIYDRGKEGEEALRTEPARRLYRFLKGEGLFPYVDASARGHFVKLTAWATKPTEDDLAGCTAAIYLSRCQGANR